MKKACLVVDEYYKKNRIFDINDKISNRDNCLYSFFALKEELKRNNIDLSTQDINSIEESDIVIYNEMPQDLSLEKNISKSYLLLFETELIKKENWNFEKHKYFNKIFTWNDDFVDNIKYFKFNFSHKIPEIVEFDIQDKSKLFTIIAGNKKSNDKRELYSKRIEAIRWFEKNHPEDFDLYGIGWDKKTFGGKLRPLNRFGFLRSLFSEAYPSYRGKVDSKSDTLSKYKFSICYENAKDISGYITEKIFDCFFAGCVPVYWGAPNVTDYIPENCFIDKRKFEKYDELYSYLKNMSAEEYQNYLRNIEKFLKSEKINQFSAEYFAGKIAKVVQE